MQACKRRALGLGTQQRTRTTPHCDVGACKRRTWARRTAARGVSPLNTLLSGGKRRTWARRTAARGAGPCAHRRALPPSRGRSSLRHGQRPGLHHNPPKNPPQSSPAHAALAGSILGAIVPMAVPLLAGCCKNPPDRTHCRQGDSGSSGILPSMTADSLPPGPGPNLRMGRHARLSRKAARAYRVPRMPATSYTTAKLRVDSLLPPGKAAHARKSAGSASLRRLATKSCHGAVAGMRRPELAGLCEPCSRRCAQLAPSRRRHAPGATACRAPPAAAFRTCDGLRPRMKGAEEVLPCT